MNEQHGNRLDQQIRQALDTLPDAPPPGSAFDSAKLWERLRPELPAQSVAAQSVAAQSIALQSVEKQLVANKKRPAVGWWLAAASLAGLLMGGLWWSGQISLKRDVVIGKSPEKTGARTGLSAQPNLSVNQPNVVVPPTEIRLITALPEKQHYQKRQGEVEPILAEKFDELADDQSLTTNSGPGISAPETPPLLLTEPDAVSVVAVQKPAITNAPKRRFRVVHANELAAEEESNVVRYRANHFVKLGTGNAASAGSGGESPALLIPLNRKSIQ